MYSLSYWPWFSWYIYWIIFREVFYWINMWSWFRNCGHFFFVILFVQKTKSRKLRWISTLRPTGVQRGDRFEKTGSLYFT